MASQHGLKSARMIGVISERRCKWMNELGTKVAVVGKSGNEVYRKGVDQLGINVGK